MAKVGLTKLGLTKNIETAKITWNEQEIEIKQYLPIEEKINLVSSVLNESIDENGFYNPIQVYVATILEMILYYTNINFTEKQKQDIGKTYDLLISSGLSSKIFEEINPYEYKQIQGWIHELITTIYEYKNSALGILEKIKEDYQDVDMNANDIVNKLSDSENLELVKDIVTKLG